MYVTHLHPFICLWPLSLLPCLGYCEQHCYEHRSACYLFIFELCLGMYPGHTYPGLLDHTSTLFSVF